MISRNRVFVLLCFWFLLTILGMVGAYRNGRTAGYSEGVTETADTCVKAIREVGADCVEKIRSLK